MCTYQYGTVTPAVGEGEAGEHVDIAHPLVAKDRSKLEAAYMHVSVCVCVSRWR